MIKNIYNLLRDWVKTHFAALILIIVLTTCAFFVLIPHIFVLIPSGYYGVVYRPLSGGVDEDMIVEEGVFITLPWNTVYKYDGRLQVNTLEMDVLTADQLKSKVKVSFQYSINSITLPILHKYIGQDFVGKVVIPEVTSATRQMFGQLNSTKAYTTGIGQAINDIAINADQVIVNKLSPGGLNDVRLVNVRAVQLEEISFPPEMAQAIQEKLVQEQNAHSYVYRIEAARLEVERKTIEAEGIKKFQGIVNSGLTDNYLKLRGIEATEKLAASQNAKMVFIGTGSKGMPLILNSDESSVSSIKSTR